jgi:agmatinase
MLKLIGIPFDANSSFLKGPALAPARIRQADLDGSANKFSENGTEILNGFNYKDLNDIYFPDTDPHKAFGIIREIFAKQLRDKDKILSLGGDHSITYPIISAYADVYDELHVLQFDAHADIYENFDNNPYSHASPFARILENNLITSLTQVGIRTLNTHHREQAETYGIKIIEMKEFNFDFVKSLRSPLYISVDLDVLDPAYAPGLSHHEPGGMTSRELISVIQAIETDIVGADIVEYNPERDLNMMTAMVAYKLFKELAAKMISNPK